MVTVRRYDRLPGSILSVHRCKEDGSLHITAYARKEGILEYQNPDGSVRRELVTRRAVDTTADTIGQKTITLHHPDGGVVTPENVQELGVGNVGSKVVVEERPAMGGYCQVLTVLRRADAIAAFESGEANEGSCGYDVDLDETPGVHPVFGRYDARQLDTRVNHFAMVPAGRAGPEVRFIRADSADRAGVLVTPLERDNTQSGPTRLDNTMKHLILMLGLLGVTQRADAKEDDLGEAAVAGLRKLKADAEELKAKLGAAEAGGDDLKDFLAAAGVADLAGLKAKLADMATSMQALKGERDALQAKLTEQNATAKAAAEKLEGERMDALAKELKIKVDGLALPAKRVAIAKTRIDSIDAKADSAFVDGVIRAIEADIKTRKRTEDASGARFDRWAADTRADAREDAKDDDFVSPHLDHLDTAFGGAQ